MFSICLKDTDAVDSFLFDSYKTTADEKCLILVMPIFLPPCNVYFFTSLRVSRLLTQYSCKSKLYSEQVRKF